MHTDEAEHVTMLDPIHANGKTTCTCRATYTRAFLARVDILMFLHGEVVMLKVFISEIKGVPRSCTNSLTQARWRRATDLFPLELCCSLGREGSVLCTPCTT
jgi:hypothetical protein